MVGRLARQSLPFSGCWTKHNRWGHCSAHPSFSEGTSRTTLLHSPTSGYEAETGQQVLTEGINHLHFISLGNRAKNNNSNSINSAAQDCTELFLVVHWFVTSYLIYLPLLPVGLWTCAAHLNSFQMYRWEMLFSRGALLIIVTVSLSLLSTATFIHTFVSFYLTHFPILPQVPLHLNMLPISLSYCSHCTRKSYHLSCTWIASLISNSFKRN